MIERGANILAKLDPLLVTILAFMLMALLAAEGWLLLLRKPFAEYQQVTTTRASLEAVLHQSPNAAGELQQLASELKQLTAQLNGELTQPATDDTVAALMGNLDHDAASHGIVLSGVKPLERTRIPMFEETTFDIAAKGSYLQLCNWMLDFNKTIGNNVTITEFDMQSAEEGKIKLTLKLALYRPLSPEGTS